MISFLLVLGCGPFNPSFTLAQGALQFSHRPEVRSGVPGEWLKWELTFSASAEDLQTMVPWLPRPMDLPLQCTLPGWSEVEGLEWKWGRGPEDGATMAVEGSLQPIDWQSSADGSGVGVLHLWVRADRVGSLELPGAVLHWAEGLRFEQDLFGERIPVEMVRRQVATPKFSLRIEDFPQLGRPPNFSGLIGPVELRSEISVDDRSGVFELRLELSAAGGLDGFVPPDLGDLPGLRSLGMVEDAAPDAAGSDLQADRELRIFRFALERSSEQRPPPFTLPYWLPGETKTYRSAVVDPWDALPVYQRASATDSLAISAPGEGAPQEDAQAERATALTLWSGGLFGAALLFVGGWWFARMRASVARRDRNRLPDQASSQTPNFIPYSPPGHSAKQPEMPSPRGRLVSALAERLGCASAAVITPDLADRLIAAGVDPSTAEASASLLEALVLAEYGGPSLAAIEQRLNPVLRRLALP